MKKAYRLFSFAGVVQWQNTSFPRMRRGFDSLHPLQINMKLYRFSPIKTKPELVKAITHTHFACHKLCKQSFARYLPVAGNIGIFCHFEDEYSFLTRLRKKMTDESDNWNKKYYRLYEPIVIPARDDVPQTTYTYLYIRKPDATHPQVGDVDFYMEPQKYTELKQSLQDGKKINGARIFERPDLDYVELYDANADAYAYVGTHKMVK
jgi:hypothetical protein